MLGARRCTAFSLDSYAIFILKDLFMNRFGNLFARIEAAFPRRLVDP